MANSVWTVVLIIVVAAVIGQCIGAFILGAWRQHRVRKMTDEVLMTVTLSDVRRVMALARKGESGMFTTADGVHYRLVEAVNVLFKKEGEDG